MSAASHASRLVAGLLLAVASIAVQADDALFRDRVAPVFEARCLNCHNGSKVEGSLSLSDEAGFRAGGDSGPAMIAGNPDESLLVDYITGDEPAMPAEGPPLSTEEVEAIRAWIKAGAVWPAKKELVHKPRVDLDWWSLRPLQRPTAPELESSWVRTLIDAFILAKLHQQRLAPTPEADRRTLVRRLYFDLIGLPPAPAAVESFVADDDTRAYEKLVDRLLAMPQYGERWGRHWLDVVRYGDTHGYDKDKLRPNAWPYRDYVIRSFNADKPYAQFVEEQIAGDVLYPDTADGVVATGFIVAGPFDYVGQIEVVEGTLAKAVTRNLDRDDMVTAAIGTFNSMTAQCARCHHHKFDPISQEDYYCLQSVFAGVDRADRPVPADDGSDSPPLVYAAATEFAGQNQFQPTHGAARTIRLLNRGNEAAPGDEVGPGACGYLPELESRFNVAADAPEGVRRAALAAWLTDHRNSLTWRSIVNRVWQYHFGRGIVDSPNDFGRMGALPSHPELLDWLAVEFRDGPQSIKQLHRLICNSAVYRQASVGNESNERIDAANQYFWRMNRRKLEAEAVHDSVLAVSGKLDSTAGGPGYRAFGFQDDESPHYDYDGYDPDDPASHRRSVYRLIVRSVPDPMLASLDCADSSSAVAKRNETLTSLQSLTMLNNKFMVRMAEHFAARVEALGTNSQQRVAAAWRLALAREPSIDELASLAAYADQHGLASACRVILNMNEFMFVD
jgi:mono/diheme cytochrome c family protein